MRKINVFFIMAFFSALTCAGCADTTPIYYSTTFNKAQAERLMRPGRNKIIINSFTTHSDGDITTCADVTSDLIPATEMAAEFMKINFGSEAGGQAVAMDAYRVTERIANPNPDFGRFWARAKCNSDGFAVFEGVADGSFYVTAGAGGYSYAQKVTVKGGETKKVVLSGSARSHSKGFNYERWHKNERRREWEANNRKQ